MESQKLKQISYIGIPPQCFCTFPTPVEVPSFTSSRPCLSA